jgi:hypothetical protein
MLKKRKVNNKDINQSITELSDSYQGYLANNNLTSDAMPFNMFIDLLVDGQLDMLFMR